MDAISAADEKLELLAQIGELLLNYVHLSKEYEREPNNYGLRETLGMDVRLNHMETHMLATIWKQPGISAQDLAGIFNRTQGAVSQILKKLTREGLIIKRENPRNARMNDLFVTPAGQLACENHAVHEREVFEKLLPLFADFSERDFEQTKQAIRIFTDHFRAELSR